MQTTSLTLLDRLATSGENADWQRLLLIYKPLVKHVVKSYPDLESQADDVTQEVMMILMRELPTFKRQRKGSFRTWLRGIIVNQLRIAARKSRRYVQQPAEGPGLEQQIDELNDPASFCCQKWEEEHDQMVLAKAMEMVKTDTNPVKWEAFQLYVLEEMPPKQVARKLEISENSVLLAKSRIMKQLREVVAGLVDGF